MLDEGCYIVIDELKICYVTREEVLQPLKATTIGEHVSLCGYQMHRIANDRFEYFFDVSARGRKVAQLRFGFYTDKEDGYPYVYLKVLNKTLYNPAEFRKILQMPDALGLEFNNFTAIDLAMDMPLNIPSIIKKMMRSKDTTTIINGKAVKDRKRNLEGVCFEYSTSLDRLNNPTITVKQKKAIHNKNCGITVQAYNKKAEIENLESEKQYILDFYGDPKRLYRLEVRLRYQEIKDYLLIRKTEGAPALLFDQGILEDMFFYHLASVIRFTKGRTKISWNALLKCNGRV